MNLLNKIQQLADKACKDTNRLKKMPDYVNVPPIAIAMIIFGYEFGLLAVTEWVSPND